MRIAMVTGEYPPHQGGIGDYTLALSHALSDLGHEVRVFTAIGETTLVNKIPQTIPVTNLRLNWRVVDVPGLMKALREYAPDLVNIQYEPAAYNMRLGIYLLPKHLQAAGIPSVVTWHDILPPYIFPKAGKFRQIIVERLAMQATANIFTNASDHRELVKRCQKRKPLTQSTVIPIGSNIAVSPPENFDRAEWRERHGYTSKTTLIGFFGFRNRAKGLEYLIDALSELHKRGVDAHLLFIGGETGTSDPTNQAYADEINARVARYGLQPYVKASGFIAQPEVSAALLGIDVCALPYLEGANLRHGTLHAALAHGCAIITTTEPDGTSALTEGQVVLVNPGDANELATAVESLSGNRDQREVMGIYAKEYSRQFHWPAIAERTLAFYSKILENPT